MNYRDSRLIKSCMTEQTDEPLQKLIEDCLATLVIAGKRLKECNHCSHNGNLEGSK